MSIPAITVAEKRRDRRIQRPELEVVIGDRTFNTRNWSLGGLGLSVKRYDHGLAEGYIVNGTVRLAKDKSAGEFEFVAKVVRVNPRQGDIGLMFEGLDEKGFTFFDRCLNKMLKRSR